MKRAKNPVKVGEIFGRLTVVSNTDKIDKDGFKYFLCQCSCGIFRDFKGASLRVGHTNSCGCLMRESCSINNRKAPGDSFYNSIEDGYKNKAKRKNRVYELTKEQFKELLIKNCVYCGMEPELKNRYFSNGKRNKNSKTITKEYAATQWFPANGIDRIDSDKGYILDNCVTCCKTCNWIKNNYEQTFFLNHINRIADFQKAKNEKK